MFQSIFCLLKNSRKWFVVLFGMIVYFGETHPQQSPVIAIKDTHFTLDGKPFEFFGVSFFNALYNPTFNQSESVRVEWLQKFRNTGITVLRIWGEWNNKMGLADAADSCILYNRDGTLKSIYLTRFPNVVDMQDVIYRVGLICGATKLLNTVARRFIVNDWLFEFRNQTPDFFPC